jgi:hypothetical protein
MSNLQLIKWALEVSNQEGYKSSGNLIKSFNIDLLGC